MSSLHRDLNEHRGKCKEEASILDEANNVGNIKSS